MNEQFGASNDSQPLAKGGFVAESVAQELEAMLSAGNYDGVKSLLSPVQPVDIAQAIGTCLLYTSPSPRDRTRSRMPSSA